MNSNVPTPQLLMVFPKYICFTTKRKKDAAILIPNIITYIQKCISLCKNKLRNNKKGNVHITLTLRCIPTTVVALENPISITFSHCVFVASGIQHAMCMHCTVICGLPGCIIFFHIIS
jgi:hypothetical protein